MAATSGYHEILYEKEEETGIVTITLNMPKRKNAFSPLTVLDFFKAMDEFEADDSAKALIITGAKDPDSNDPKKEAFSSGGFFDLKFMEELSEEIKAQIDLTDPAQKKLFIKMWAIDKPIVAAINGLAVGFGFTLPLGCADLIYMSEHAWATLPFAVLGIVPEFASTYILPRIVGFQKAKEILFMGERITAQQAFDLNLVNKVLPHDELIPYAREQTLRLIPPKGAGQAIRVIKRALHKPLIDGMTAALDLENEGLNKMFTTSDFKEAIVARLERRAPVFKGA
ncbi:enoyl-CoA hydratase/isomerase family protein [Thermodesulfobacteriota bacterium]